MPPPINSGRSLCRTALVELVTTLLNGHGLVRLTEDSIIRSHSRSEYLLFKGNPTALLAIYTHIKHQCPDYGKGVIFLGPGSKHRHNGLGLFRNTKNVNASDYRVSVCRLGIPKTQP
jgi:hypothetical protein